MQVGDLVMFPCDDEITPIGIVLRTTPDRTYGERSLRTTPDGINRGTPGLGRRIKVYWVQDREVSWEPIKWMEVISESR